TFPIPYYIAGSPTAGPDGNLWLSPVFGAANSVIARITPSGALAAFPLPAGTSPPSRLTAGPDGNLWFTETSGFASTSVSAIPQITPPRAITTSPLPPHTSP